MKMLKRLQAYQHEHNGSCNVPRGYRQDPKLGEWVKTQRKKYKSGLLAKERCDQLEAIGIEWTATCGRPVQDQKWTQMLKRLHAYQQEHNGRSNVPQRYRRDSSLGHWVSNQRYLKKHGVLTKERSNQLDAIGFEWKDTGCQWKRLRKWAKKMKILQASQQESEHQSQLDPKLANMYHEVEISPYPLSPSDAETNDWKELELEFSQDWFMKFAAQLEVGLI